jgi:hypothetical protein
MLLLFNQVLCSSYLTLMLLLLNLLRCSSWSTCYSIPLVQLAAPFASHYSSAPFVSCYYSSCSTLLLIVHLGTFLFHLSFCYSLLLLFQIGTSPCPLYFFASVQELFKFEFLKWNLENENSFFSIFVCWWVF